MTIEVELPDGTVLEYPDGTSDDVMKKATKKYWDANQPKTNGAGQSTAADPEEEGWLEWAGNKASDAYHFVADEGAGQRLSEFGKAAVESGSFGLLGDEARAGALAGLGYLTGDDATYDELLADQRAQEEEFRTENPWASGVADVTGAFVPGLGWLGAGVKGTNLAIKGAKAAGAGAAMGGAYGFMEGEGGFQDRLNNAVVPAALGLGLGAATPALGALARGAYTKFGPGVAAEARKVTSELGLNRETAEIVTDAIRRDAPHSADALARAGDDAIVGEMGVNTNMLLDVLANRRGSAEAVRKGVEDIATTRAGKFTSALDDKLGTPTGADRRVGQLMQETAPAREAAYDDAYEQLIDYGTTAGQELKGLFSRVPARVITKANELLELDGLPALQVSKVADEAGNVTVQTLPNVRQVDYLSRALDDMVDSLAGAGQNASGAYGRFSGELRKALGKVVPEYKAASGLGQNTIKDREAIELGSNLFSKRNPVDVVESKLEGMSKSELNFARLGLRDAIGEMMDNAKRAMTDTNMDVREIMAPLREITSAGGQAKLRALLGEEAEAVLRAADEAYSGLSLRANVVRGSGTVTRQIMNEQLDGTVSPGVMEALQRGDGPTGALGTLVAKLAGNPAAGRLAKVDANAEKIANALLQRAKGSRMVQQLPRLIDDVATKGAKVDVEAQRIARIANALQARRTGKN